MANIQCDRVRRAVDEIVRICDEAGICLTGDDPFLTLSFQRPGPTTEQWQTLLTEARDERSTLDPTRVERRRDES